MPVGIGVKRVKPTFQQVLLQLNPFFWQGDASWKWNSKVELWTGAAPDFVSPFPATALPPSRVSARWRDRRLREPARHSGSSRVRYHPRSTRLRLAPRPPHRIPRLRRG